MCHFASGENPGPVLVFGVPIRPFLDDAAFDPETVEAMGKALAGACEMLGLRDKEDAANLASRIIDLARDGIHDPELLKAAALKRFHD